MEEYTHKGDTLPDNSRLFIQHLLDNVEFNGAKATTELSTDGTKIRLRFAGNHSHRDSINSFVLRLLQVGQVPCAIENKAVTIDNPSVLDKDQFDLALRKQAVANIKRAITLRAGSVLGAEPLIKLEDATIGKPENGVYQAKLKITRPVDAMAFIDRQHRVVAGLHAVNAVVPLEGGALPVKPMIDAIIKSDVAQLRAKSTGNWETIYYSAPVDVARWATIDVDRLVGSPGNRIKGGPSTGLQR